MLLLSLLHLSLSSLPLLCCCYCRCSSVIIIIIDSVIFVFLILLSFFYPHVTLFIILWFSIGERRNWFCEKNYMCIEYDRTPVETNSYLSCVPICWVVGVSRFFPYHRLHLFYFSLWSSICTSLLLGGCHFLFPFTLTWYHWFDLKWNKMECPLKSYLYMIRDTWYILYNIIVYLYNLYMNDQMKRGKRPARRRKCSMIRW